jgi:hypothetical protein
MGERMEGRYVEVKVDSAVVVEEKITKDVGALDGVGIGCVEGEEMRVVRTYKEKGGGVGPKLSLLVSIHSGGEMTGLTKYSQSSCASSNFF